MTLHWYILWSEWRRALDVFEQIDVLIGWCELMHGLCVCVGNVESDTEEANCNIDQHNG